MNIEHDSDLYRLERDRFGFFTLTRKSDGATQFFQSQDDCDLWDRNLRTMRQGKAPPASFDGLCASYDYDDAPWQPKQ